MSRRPFLKAISSAAPCASAWSSLPGTDRVRRCAACGNCVYRLQGLPSTDADALLAWTEGRPVKRLYAREDGSLMARDCSVGREAEVQRERRLRRSRWAALGMAVCGFLGLAAAAPEEPPPSHAATPLASADLAPRPHAANAGHAEPGMRLSPE